MPIETWNFLGCYRYIFSLLHKNQGSYISVSNSISNQLTGLTILRIYNLHQNCKNLDILYLNTFNWRIFVENFYKFNEYCMQKWIQKSFLTSSVKCFVIKMTEKSLTWNTVNSFHTELYLRIFILVVQM